ncbi:MAG: hypothetical protein EA363_05415 [Balneolaceae bacterium]|nr:MAG: hypothetical protein EA363_05415 [Balneolaceae bacterium]
MTANPEHTAPNADAVAKELGELTPIAEFRGLRMYHFSGDECPATLLEVGRLREKGFMAIGAGRGVECDLDDYDFGENAYYQLVAWDPDENEMVAIYRYQPGSRGIEQPGKPGSERPGKPGNEHPGKPGSERPHNLRTANLFDFSDTFRERLLPRAIELGRSVANPTAKRHRFGFFAIWKGLGALLRIYPQTRYFFGTVSFHTHMNQDAVRCIISYLQTHYAPPEPMLSPKKEIAYSAEAKVSKPADKNKSGNKDASGLGVPDAVEPGDPDTPEKRIKHLTTLMEHYGETVPMILKSYMSLTKGIWFDGAVIDHDFSDACIISLIVPLENIDPEFRDKFMQE